MSLTHRQSGTRLYGVWQGIISRCTCPTNTVYRYYGGAGISVCKSWRKSFQRFAAWAKSAGYQDGLTIDRFPDKKGDYKPSNCRWVTLKDNCRNRATNHEITAFGETKLVVEWAEDSRCRVSETTLRQRFSRYGWDAERAIVTPKTMCLRGERVPIHNEVAP